MMVLLEGDELAIAMRALNNASTETHSYLVLHAKEGVFKGISAGLDETFTAEQLAIMIVNAKKNGVPIFPPNRKLVLLSCNDEASTKALVEALGELEGAPRSVIAWEGEVKVFENGRIEGAGACKEFRAGQAAQDITTSAPRGSNAVASGRFVRLGGFTEQLKKNGLTALLAKYNDLDDALRAKFISDFGSDANALAHFNLNSGELVNVWKSIENSPIRTSYYWLTRINSWNKARIGFSYASVGNVVKVFRYGAEVAEINQTFLKIIFRGFGGDIICPIDKTVTVIGQYREFEPLTGIWYLTEDLKLYKTGSNKGGINLLNLPDAQWSPTKNIEWLRDAVSRDDIIRIISNPNDPLTHYKNGIPPGQPGYIRTTVTHYEIRYLEQEAMFKYIYDASIPGYRRL